MRKLIKTIVILSVIAISLVKASTLLSKPAAANSEWKQDSKGWWYSEGNSYATGWKLIDKNWYYFYSDGYMAHDTTIDGYNLNSSGIWADSAETLLGREMLKNISAQNQTFTIKCSSKDVDINNLGNIFDSEIEKLKITDPYDIYNVSNYDLNATSNGFGTINIKVNCNYKMTAQMEAELDTKVKELVARIAPNSMSESKKELAIHDWIVNNTKYDESYKIFDPYNTLMKHTGVCEGYSLLAQKMFTTAGIKSTIVEGTADGEAHAWNLVYIDGKWRHVDCTWDDPVSSVPVLRHNCYNLTDKQISADHSWTTSNYPSAN